VSAAGWLYKGVVNAENSRRCGSSCTLIAASPLAYAQAPSARAERITEADLAALTDARVNIVKAALQLTPDQEKYWQAIEDTIRANAKDRQTRIANLAKAAAELRDRSPFEVLRDRNPVDFLDRRASALSERAADIKKLADAWRPLYQTLTPDQKRRMAQLAMTTLRELRNGLERRRVLAEEDEDEF
jgi:hypothetical protein